MLFGYRNIYTHYINVYVPTYSQEGVQGAVLHVLHHDHHWPACIQTNTCDTILLKNGLEIRRLKAIPNSGEPSALSKTKEPRMPRIVRCSLLWTVESMNRVPRCMDIWCHHSAPNTVLILRVQSYICTCCLFQKRFAKKLQFIK